MVEARYLEGSEQPLSLHVAEARYLKESEQLLSLYLSGDDV